MPRGLIGFYSTILARSHWVHDILCAVFITDSHRSSSTFVMTIFSRYEHKLGCQTGCTVCGAGRTGLKLIYAVSEKPQLLLLVLTKLACGPALPLVTFCHLFEFYFRYKCHFLWLRMPLWFLSTCLHACLLQAVCTTALAALRLDTGKNTFQRTTLKNQQVNVTARKCPV